MRIPAPAPTGPSGTVVLRPYHHTRRDLPPFEAPDPPPGGWTLDSAVAAAWAYAEAHGLGSTAAELAFEALADHDDPPPPGHRAEERAPRLYRASLMARLDRDVPDPFPRDDTARRGPPIPHPPEKELDPMTTTARARYLVDSLDAEKRPGARLDVVRRYGYDGEHDLPVGVPRRARREFRALAAASREHRIPAVVQTLTAPLRVVGFRASGTNENAAPWANWQANGLDARQDGVHFDALAAGVGYVRVTPSTRRGVAAITPCSFDAVAAWYANEHDDWPAEVVEYVGTTTDASHQARRVFDVWTPDARQRFTEADTTDAPDGLVASEPEPHTLGVVPFVRFRERWGASTPGLAVTLKPQADRLNRGLFSLEVMQQYASHRQRWAVGLLVPEDEDGNPTEPFDAAADRLWVSDNPDAKFGEFQASDPSGALANIKDARDALAVLAGVQPGLVEGLDVAGAKSGAAATSSSLMDRRLAALSASFGESWEQVLRLAALASGDADGAADDAARVVWQTIEAESVQATVTALATAVGSLGLPPEATWPALVATLPGATADDLVTWRALARNRSGATAAAAEFVRSGANADPAPVEAAA